MPSHLGEAEDSAELAHHLSLLQPQNRTKSEVEITNTPIFCQNVRRLALQRAKHTTEVGFTQYGLLAGISPGSQANRGVNDAVPDPRLFYNVSTPSSVFICGSQGSGKSHTLSCLLENCLVPSVANRLPRPLTGIVFHYDTFNSDTGGTPSEAAFLSSSKSVKVRVLCAPTNRVKIEKIYGCLPNVVVEDFRIHESQLNTKRMLDLMAMSSVAGDSWPLYMHSVTRILRNMRLEQQVTGEEGFNYGDFKARLTDEALIGSQLGPLQQRLDALESFMVSHQATQTRLRTGQGKWAKNGTFNKSPKTVDNTWTPKAGQLTIVDLSCPCITDVTACSLFNICLSLFLEQDSEVGRVVALDEAHKYMRDSIECVTLTESLLSTIRLQRHLAARVFISTQEPTISPKLLDLCSVTIVHRFTSPEWLNTLRGHLAGAANLARPFSTSNESVAGGSGSEVTMPPLIQSEGTETRLAEIFAQIVSLRTGEALLFAPNAAIGVRMGRRTIPEDNVDECSSSSDAASETTMESWRSPKGSMRLSLSKLDIAAENSSGIEGDLYPTEAIRLVSGVLKICIRNRVTQDGGKSILAK